MEILNLRKTANGYLINGTTETIAGDGNYQNALDWDESGKEVMAEYTQAELEQQIEVAKPKIVTMRQARIALSRSGSLQAVTDAIANSSDEELKIEWEYAITVDRNWDSLIALTTSLGWTSPQLDDLFALADSL